MYTYLLLYTCTRTSSSHIRNVQYLVSLFRYGCTRGIRILVCGVHVHKLKEKTTHVHVHVKITEKERHVHVKITKKRGMSCEEG